MRRDEAAAVSRLAGLALGGGTTRIHELHGSIAGRAFAGVGAAAGPVRVIHDGIASLTYGAVALALRAGAAAVGVLASRRVDGRPLDDTPTGPAAPDGRRPGRWCSWWSRPRRRC